MLADGKLHPHRCDSDNDCVSINGIKGSCLCGFDGHAYCQPLWGSEVFEEMWEYCSDSEELDYDYWLYWNTLQNYYTYYIETPDCGRSLFFELFELEDKPDNGLSLILGGIIIIFAL